MRNSTNKPKKIQDHHSNGHSKDSRISGYIDPGQKPVFEELKRETASRDGDREPRANGIYFERIIKHRLLLDEESCREYAKIAKRRRDQNPARL